jgi:hypothetical protein
MKVALPVHPLDLAALVSAAVIAVCGFALHHALRRTSTTRIERLAIATVVILLTVGGVLWAISNPQTAQSTLIPQILAATYALFAVGSGVTQHTTHGMPATSVTERGKSIERKRIRGIMLACGVFMVGCAAAIGSYWVPPGTLRWGCNGSACVLSILGTILALFHLRRTAVPDGRAVFQRGKCFKVGDRYLPLDDDRHILLHVRMEVVPIRLDQAFVIQWVPDSKQILIFARNFSTDADAKQKLHELAQYCTGANIVKYAGRSGIEVKVKPKIESNMANGPSRRMRLPPKME